MIQKCISYCVAICILTSCSTTPKRHSLNEKLNKQWSNYLGARDLLLGRIDNPKLTLEQKPLTRSQWEEKLQLNESYAFLPEDLAQLKEQQSSRVEKSRLLAIQNSKIDLNLIREKGFARRFCSALPKGGLLHVHPAGTLTAKSIHEMLKLQNPVIQLGKIGHLTPVEITWINSLPVNKKFSQLTKANQKKFETFLLLPKGHQEFERFNAVFHFISLLGKEIDIYTVALEAFAKQAYQEGVIYVELTGHVSPETLALVEKIQNKTHLMLRMNRSFNRTESIQEIENKWQKTLLLERNPFFVGIDLLDNEDSNAALEKGQILYGSALSAKLHGKTDLHRTMHAGELGDPRNSRDAIIMGAERIGHGVLLEKDVVALEFAAKIKMPIEINLSSNLRLTKVEALSKHPFLKYLRLGLPVSLSTDDEGIFEIDINHECEIAINDSDVTYFEMRQMAINSIETSFASAEDKSALLKTLNVSFANFEKNWKN